MFFLTMVVQTKKYDFTLKMLKRKEFENVFYFVNVINGEIKETNVVFRIEFQSKSKCFIILVCFHL